MITLQIIQTSLGSIGTLMVGYAAIAIHYRIMHEHTIDEAVESEMKREQKIAIIGVICIVLALCLDIALLLSI